MAKGNRGGKRGSANSTIPKMNNPAGIPSNHMTEQEYLALLGLGDVASGIGIDRYAGANMYHLSNKQRQQTLSDINAQNDVYYANRAKAKSDYKTLVSQGKIVPKTRIEQIITKAHGHSYNSATQAARRMAQKMGYDWRTGNKLKGGD